MGSITRVMNIPPSILAGNVRTRDAFRPVALEQEYLIDHNFGYSPVLARVYLVFDAFRSITREQKYLMGNNAEWSEHPLEISFVKELLRKDWCS